MCLDMGWNLDCTNLAYSPCVGYWGKVAIWNNALGKPRFSSKSPLPFSLLYSILHRRRILRNTSRYISCIEAIAGHREVRVQFRNSNTLPFISFSITLSLSFSFTPSAKSVFLTLSKETPTYVLLDYTYTIPEAKA